MRDDISNLTASNLDLSLTVKVTLLLPFFETDSISPTPFTVLTSLSRREVTSLSITFAEAPGQEEERVRVAPLSAGSYLKSREGSAATPSSESAVKRSITENGESLFIF